MSELSSSGAMAQVIQMAVAPVFLLTAIGTLLSVMASRLARVIDRARLLEARLENATTDQAENLKRHLATLSRRAKLINLAITLSTTTALLVCTVIALLFMGDFLLFNVRLPVSILFISAMFSLVLALITFLREVYIATTSLRIGPQQ